MVAAGPALGKRFSASAAAARWLAKMPTYFATPGTVILIFSMGDSYVFGKPPNHPFLFVENIKTNKSKGVFYGR
jgi:hypothetical protein